MNRTQFMVAAIASSAVIAVALTACQTSAGKSEAAGADGMIQVNLCDGETSIQTKANAAMSAEDGQRIADELMAEWLKKNPMEEWEATVRERHDIMPASDNRHLLAGGQTDGHTYGNYSEMNLLRWKRETEKLVVEGARVFHSGTELGSTIAVSCDMCHPDASNTHPETYPKFQVQRGQVSLLRDMINWCIENPVRGPKLDADDPKMRAMEAYIYAMRSGKVLEYGKH